MRRRKKNLYTTDCVT